MILIAATPLAWLLRFGTWILLGWSLYRTVRVHARRKGPGAVEEIEIDKDREISVRFSGSAAWQGCQLRASFVHPWIMLLSLHCDDRKWPVNVVVAADAVEPEAFRRWRVALKLQAVAG